MEWTFDLRVDVTPAAVAALAARTQRTAGRGYKPTGIGRRTARPLLQARDAVEALRDRPADDPNTCTVCCRRSVFPGGPSCSDDACPNRLYLPGEDRAETPSGNDR